MLIVPPVALRMPLRLELFDFVVLSPHLCEERSTANHRQLFLSAVGDVLLPPLGHRHRPSAPRIVHLVPSLSPLHAVPQCPNICIEVTSLHTLRRSSSRPPTGSVRAVLPCISAAVRPSSECQPLCQPSRRCAAVDQVSHFERTSEAPRLHIQALCELSSAAIAEASIARSRSSELLAVLIQLQCRETLMSYAVPPVLAGAAPILGCLQVLEVPVGGTLDSLGKLRARPELSITPPLA